MKKFKAKYAITSVDGKSEMKERIVEASNEIDVQKELCKEAFGEEDNRKVIKVASINELDESGQEIIVEGQSGGDSF